jgi:uncharacterized protein YdeI (YjbR/CyaY-like superfamily)
VAGKDDLPQLSFGSRAEWESWLAEHHEASTGVWIVFAKKGSGSRGLTYAEAVEVALCYGWIDGQGKSVDAKRYKQRYTPRTARSRWSKLNRTKAMALVDAGRMQRAGLREIERAQADGRWDAAYDPPSTATVPDDLQQALDANPAARAAFGQLDSRNRYAILYRVQDAKKAETRARRIDQFVVMLAKGEKLYP